jgi:hypothetical protein
MVEKAGKIIHIEAKKWELEPVTGGPCDKPKKLAHRIVTSDFSCSVLPFIQITRFTQKPDRLNEEYCHYIYVEYFVGPIASQFLSTSRASIVSKENAHSYGRNRARRC